MTPTRGSLQPPVRGSLPWTTCRLSRRGCRILCAAPPPATANVKRALYTDSDLAVIKFRRCVIINGIDVGAVRPDTSRSDWRLSTLRRIDRHMRQPEATMRQQWRTALPGILGGLLDLAAVVHQRLENHFGRRVATDGGLQSHAGGPLTRFCRPMASGVTCHAPINSPKTACPPTRSSNSYGCTSGNPLVAKSGGDLLATVTPTGDTWRRAEGVAPGTGGMSRPSYDGTHPRYGVWVGRSKTMSARNHRNVLLWTVYPALQRCVGQTTLAILASLAHFGSAGAVVLCSRAARAPPDCPEGSFSRRSRRRGVVTALVGLAASAPSGRIWTRSLNGRSGLREHAIRRDRPGGHPRLA